MKTIIYTLFLSIFISSCAFHSGMVSSDLAPEGVHYEDIAHGYSQTVHFLGIGGLDRDALILEAKRNMYRNRPLKKGERYLNITVDFKTSYFLARKVKCVISSDVISTDKNAESVFSENYSDILKGKEKYEHIFSVGDTVMTRAEKEYVILGFKQNKKKVLLEEVEGTMELNHKARSLKNIFVKLDNHRGYKLGDIVVSESSKYEIQGFGLERVKVLSKNNTLYHLKYTNIKKAPAE